MPIDMRPGTYLNPDSNPCLAQQLVEQLLKKADRSSEIRKELGEMVVLLVHEFARRGSFSPVRIINGKLRHLLKRS